MHCQVRRAPSAVGVAIEPSPVAEDTSATKRAQAPAPASQRRKRAGKATQIRFLGLARVGGRTGGCGALAVGERVCQSDSFRRRPLTGAIYGAPHSSGQLSARQKRAPGTRVLLWREPSPEDGLHRTRRCRCSVMAEGRQNLALGRGTEPRQSDGCPTPPRELPRCIRRSTGAQGSSLSSKLDPHAGW